MDASRRLPGMAPPVRSSTRLAMRLKLTIGAVLAGGRSRRFGSPKGAAELGGRSLADRVTAAHREAFETTVLVGGDPVAAVADLGLPMIPDRFAGRGPLGGVHAALAWAADRHAAGICCTPLDAPFVRPELLRALAAQGEGFRPRVLAVVPRSRGPLGFEPLFAWYGVDALPAVEEMLARGEGSMRQLIERLEPVRFLSLEAVLEIGDPDTIFHNVNTPADLERARLALGEEGGARDVDSGGERSG
jgi:molybdenum cofactor guanylyltransferase